MGNVRKKATLPLPQSIEQDSDSSQCLLGPQHVKTLLIY
jgi:hypothetical protein